MNALRGLRLQRLSTPEIEQAYNDTAKLMCITVELFLAG